MTEITPTPLKRQKIEHAETKNYTSKLPVDVFTSHVFPFVEAKDVEAYSQSSKTGTIEAYQTMINLNKCRDELMSEIENVDQKNIRKLLSNQRDFVNRVFESKCAKNLNRVDLIFQVYPGINLHLINEFTKAATLQDWISYVNRHKKFNLNDLVWIIYNNPLSKEEKVELFRHLVVKNKLDLIGEYNISGKRKLEDALPYLLQLSKDERILLLQNNNHFLLQQKQFLIEKIGQTKSTKKFLIVSKMIDNLDKGFDFFRSKLIPN